jgi:tetratricopeptide (TPR) repeat protein
MREDLKANLLNLQGLEFIYEKKLFPELEYIFKHALTQEVAYNSLLQKRRKGIHENIGQAIEEIYTERLEEFYEMLAYHYSKSENQEKAYEYLKRSGEKAASNYSHFEALRFYKQAINALDHLSETKENIEAQIEIRLLMALPLSTLSFPEDSLKLLQEGEKLSKEAGDRKSLASFYFYISRYYNYKGDLLKGINYVENSFREAEKINDIEWMVPNAFALTLAYNLGGEYSKIFSLGTSVIDLIQKTGRKSESFGLPYNAYSYSCSTYGLSLGYLGNFEEGKVYFEKALRNATKIGDIVTILISELWYSLLFLVKGDGKLAVEHAQNSLRYSEEAKWPFYIGLAWSCLGYGYYLLGDLKTAQKNIEKGLKIHSDTGAETQLSAHHTLLSMVLSDSSDLRKAANCNEKALELSQKNNERHWEGFSRIIMGRIVGKGDPSQTDKAEEYILQGTKQLGELKIRPISVLGYLFLGEIYADTGQREKALENLKKAEAESKKMEMDHWLAKTYAGYAELYKKEGEEPKAKENLSKAIEILKECGPDGWVEKYEKELAEIY